MKLVKNVIHGNINFFAVGKWNVYNFISDMTNGMMGFRRALDLVLFCNLGL